MTDPVQKARDMQARALKRVPKEAAQQLMFWPEKMRGLPNPLARCALFTSSGKGEARSMYKRQEIVAVQGYLIQYTGEELRQDDQDVFLQIVHLARMYPLGNEVEVTGHAILQALGWGRSTPNYDRLKNCIGRLVEGTVWVTFNDGRQGYTGRLIDSLEWKGVAASPERVRWKIFIDPRIIALFGENAFTLIDWEQRLSLRALAKWLHSFYFTHREPYPYSVETLHKLCGSKTKDLNKFRYKLKEALADLVEVGFFIEAQVDPRSDTVMVKRRARVLAA